MKCKTDAQSQRGWGGVVDTSKTQRGFGDKMEESLVPGSGQLYSGDVYSSTDDVELLTIP